jgi:hypothetical protein
MSVLYALQHIGYAIAPQADAGWIGEAGPGPSYLDQRSGGPDNDFTNRNTTFMTWNLLHMARMLVDAGGIPAHGNQRSEWDAGCRFDFDNPEYRYRRTCVGLYVVNFFARDGGIALMIWSNFHALATTMADEANYDESLVPDYVLPDALIGSDGCAVTTGGVWQAQRRPELLRLFEEHVYGGMPDPLPETHSELFDEDPNALRGQALRRQFSLRFGAGEQVSTMDLLLYLPHAIQQPVPVFLGLNFADRNLGC